RPSLAQRIPCRCGSPKGDIMGVTNTLFCRVAAQLDRRKKDKVAIMEGRMPFRSASTWVRVKQAGQFAFCFGLLLLLTPSVFAGTVTLSPGSNVPSIVQSYPSGTTFKFAAGVYRLSRPIVPKDDDIFIG